MKLSELINALNSLKGMSDPDIDVCFDTEAGTFTYHLANVDAAYLISEEQSPSGKAFIQLITRDPIIHCSTIKCLKNQCEVKDD